MPPIPMPAMLSLLLGAFAPKRLVEAMLKAKAEVVAAPDVLRKLLRENLDFIGVFQYLK